MQDIRTHAANNLSNLKLPVHTESQLFVQGHFDSLGMVHRVSQMRVGLRGRVYVHSDNLKGVLAGTQMLEQRLKAVGVATHVRQGTGLHQHKDLVGASPKIIGCHCRESLRAGEKPEKRQTRNQSSHVANLNERLELAKK